MAIIQISKIQQRSGNLVDLPQLDEAQFGWASDAKRLFIGKTTPNENIEVLTSYSNISFSQVDGSGNSNVNITANSLTDGQLLTYVALTNTWENYTGNSSQIGNSKLQLGSASNISITGGAGGYVLETDGIGNLAWTSKGTLRTPIAGLSNATPIIMTVATSANVPYVNGLAVTISGANAANANTIVNGDTFYVKVGVDFPTTGNVELYTSPDLAIGNAAVGTNLGTYTANSGIATALLSGSGTANAGGAVNTIQFNDGGILNGSSNFTITGGNVVSLTGNLSASNINGGNLVTANFFTGTLTTAAQPNITSTGTLASLSVTGNANVGNLNTGGLVTATGNIRGGNLTTSGALSVTGNANIGNIGTGGLITATGNIRGANLSTGGALSATGNANVGNIGATAGVFTTVTGSLVTAAQPNITSTGTLAGLVVGGAITPNANITYDLGNTTNRFKDIYLSNSTIYLGTQTISANATSVIISGNIVSNIVGNISGNATTAGTVTTNAQSNITSVGTLTSLDVSGTVTASRLVSNVATGTAPFTVTSTTQVANLSVATAGLATYATTANAVAGANVSGAVAYATTANAVAGANVSGAVAYATTANAVAGANVSGAVAYATTANSVAGSNVSGQVGNALVAGTVYTAAQPNITSVSTSFTNLTFANAQTIRGNNMTLTTGANTNAGTITGNWSLSTGSRLQATYADLAEYYEADAEYAPGTVLAFGGEKEVTIAEDGTTRVAGVVSTDPAYAMNAKCPGVAVAIALQGRVPTKVRGTIRKGDMMVSAGNGFARPWNNPQMGMVIGKALEDFDGIEGVIEVAIGRL